MKSTVLYLLVFSLVFVACEDDTPTNTTTSPSVPNTPAGRQQFFQDRNDSLYKITAMSLPDSTIIPELDSMVVKDWYKALPDCVLDNEYIWIAEFGSYHFNVEANSTCSSQSNSSIDRAIAFESWDDSLNTARATFRNNNAVNEFLGFSGSTVGTGYNGYEMEWSFIHVTSDSLVVEARFLQRQLPNITITFTPI